MSKKNQKLVTPDIFRQALIGSFAKLNPVYMMKNPVMFVVEVGCFITLCRGCSARKIPVFAPTI